MDVHCLNCGEPWDTYHLRHDAIYDAIADGGLWPDITIAMLDADDLRQKVRERFKDQKLTDEIREAFRAVKWEFGASILVVHLGRDRVRTHLDALGPERFRQAGPEGRLLRREQRAAGQQGHLRA